MGFSFCSISRKCPREMDLRIPMEVRSDHPCGLVKELQKPYVLHLIFTTVCDTGRHGGAHNRNWRTDALILLSFFPYFKVNFLIFLIRTEPIYLPPPPQNHSIFLIIHLVLCIPVSRWGGDTLCCFFFFYCFASFTQVSVNWVERILVDELSQSDWPVIWCGWVQHLGDDILGQAALSCLRKQGSKVGKP